jgi:hypothetical protein
VSVRAAAALLLGLTLAAGVAEAALPAPPFALDVTPARVAPGQAVTVTLTPRGGPGVFDLYLMWALVPEAAFLTPEGAWSPRPVAFRAGMAATGAPVSLRWVPGPPGEIPLALVAVPAGADPLARFGWRFRPVVVEIHARPPAPAVALDLAALAPVALGTLLACALVLLAGKPFLG